MYFSSELDQVQGDYCWYQVTYLHPVIKLFELFLLTSIAWNRKRLDLQYKVITGE